MYLHDPYGCEFALGRQGEMNVEVTANSCTLKGLSGRALCKEIILIASLHYIFPVDVFGF